MFASSRDETEGIKLLLQPHLYFGGKKKSCGVREVRHVDSKEAL